jgi:hypothetical protein
LSGAARAGVSGRRAGEETGSLQESLELERKKNEELRAKIERLETDKSVLAQDAPVAHVDSISQFRDKIRRLKKLPNLGGRNPEAELEVSAIETDFQRFILGRAKNPHAYTEAVKAFYEEALKGGEAALTPEQARALAAMLAEMEHGLTRIQETSNGAHLIRELELESSMRAKLVGLLTEAQGTSLDEGLLSDVVSAGSYSRGTYYRKDGVQQVAAQWMQSYGLEENQQLAAQMAAGVFVAAMTRIDQQMPGNGSYAYDQSAAGYDYRIRALREQMAALRILEAALTPEQRDRVKGETIHEFFFIDPNPRPPIVPAPQDK